MTTVAPMTRLEQQLKALEWFKDWSNYLLITTVAALGWVAVKGQTVAAEVCISAVVVALAFSIVFGMCTLAVIPILATKLKEDGPSFYEIDAEFQVFWMWGRIHRAKIKHFCWLQHVLFVVGIGLYAVAVLIEQLSK